MWPIFSCLDGVFVVWPASADTLHSWWKLEQQKTMDCKLHRRGEEAVVERGVGAVTAFVGRTVTEICVKEGMFRLRVTEAQNWKQCV